MLTHLAKKVGDKLDYIKHHGIIGQKWGVRRYQNADGTLTDKGEQRYRKVAGSERLIKKNTRAAKRYYSDEISVLNRIASTNESVAKSHYAKAVKYKNKSESNPSNRSKYESKMKKEMQTVNKYFNATVTSEMLAKYSEKKLSDINGGTIKAGQDFIVVKGMIIDLKK